MPFDDFTWSARCLSNETLEQQRADNLLIMSYLLDGKDRGEDLPVVNMWEGYERALLAYQQAVCREWSSVRGYPDQIWDQTRLMFLDVIIDPMATPLVPPAWMGDVDLHISHQSYLLRTNEEHYRKHFPGIKTDHPLIWPVRTIKEKA